MIHGWIGLILVFSFQAYSATATPKLNVRIAKKLKSIVVHGMDLNKDNFIEKKQYRFQGLKSIKFNCKNQSKNIQVEQRPVLLASVSSPTGIISWKNQRYKGDLLVSTNKDYQSCDLIYQPLMEDYISSLLAKEMHGQWPLEALKAQAIAARTYALDKLNRNKDETFTLENSEKHQVNGTFFDETISTRKAAVKTKGLVLTSPKGKLVPAFFHSKCGGKTLRPEQVWTNSINGYAQVDCPYCHPHGKKDWMRSFTKNRLLEIIEKVVGQKLNIASLDLKLVPDNFAKDDFRFYLDGDQIIIPKSKFRKVLGREILPSNNFRISQVKYNGAKSFVLRGKGNGHGVGLCQFGAFEMARQGMTYRQIISHYYPNLKIKKIY